jgi:hypothetical protein
MKYRKGYKYQLAKTINIQTDLRPPDDIFVPFATLYKDGRFQLIMGYACDGASGPTIDTPGTFRGAFFHDAGYQMLRLEKLPPEWRKKFDKMAHRLWSKDMKWQWRADWWYRSVRKVASFAADPKNKRKIYEVP